MPTIAIGIVEGSPEHPVKDELSLCCAPPIGAASRCRVIIDEGYALTKSKLQDKKLLEYPSVDLKIKM